MAYKLQATLKKRSVFIPETVEGRDELIRKKRKGKKTKEDAES